MGDSTELSQIYQDMREHFKKVGKEVHKESKVTLRFLPQFFNYSSLENQAYKDMFSKRQKLLEKFVSKSNETLAKKEKLFKAAKPEKWELSSEDFKRKDDLLLVKETAFQ